MAVWQIDLTLTGPLGTPLRSNTLWGHLCWALRYREGEKALSSWLGAQESSPLLLSDAFPHRWLPRPLLRPSSRSNREDLAAGDLDSLGRLGRLSTMKKLRRRAWVGLDDFRALQPRFSETALYACWSSGTSPGAAPPAQTVRRVHNRIDRRTGGTPDEGGLYFQDETWHGGDGPHLWAFASGGGLTASRLEELLNAVGHTGYGRDASTGRGRFVASVRDEPTGLFSQEGNRWETLSRGTLTAGMNEPRYRLETHYGRLGAERAADGYPFKRPLLLIGPGSTFAGGTGPHGEFLTDVHPSRGDVRENACHLCVPFTEVEP